MELLTFACRLFAPEVLDHPPLSSRSIFLVSERSGRNRPLCEVPCVIYAPVHLPASNSSTSCLEIAIEKEKPLRKKRLGGVILQADNGDTGLLPNQQVRLAGLKENTAFTSV